MCVCFGGGAFVGRTGGRTIHDIVHAVDVGELHELDNPALEATEKALAEAKLLRSRGAVIRPSARASDDRTPTHFVCFRVTKPAIKSLVASVQDAIVSRCPQLSQAMSAPTTLHCTFCMLRLTSDDAVATAARVLSECGPLLAAHLPASAPLRFQELKAFEEGKVTMTRKTVDAVSLSTLVASDRL